MSMKKMENNIDLLDEGAGSAALRRLTNNPFLVVGMTGFVAALGVGMYKYKRRPKGMSPGLFLVQLRVVAQSAVIGSLTIGMAYGMFEQYVLKKKPEH